MPNRAANPLMPGMIARVEIETGTSDNAITIPYDAVVDLSGQEITYIMVGDSAQERQVKLGRTVGDRVVVTSGLNAGENLIVSGQESVAQGMAVRVTNSIHSP